MSRAGILHATERRWNTSDSPFNHLYTVFQKSAEMLCTRSSSFEQQQSPTWAAKTEEEQIKSHLCVIYFEESLIFLLVLQLKGERKVINTWFLYILCRCGPTIPTDVLLLVLLSPNFQLGLDKGGGVSFRHSRDELCHTILFLWHLSKTLITGFTHNRSVGESRWWQPLFIIRLHLNNFIAW